MNKEFTITKSILGNYFIITFFTESEDLFGFIEPVRTTYHLKWNSWNNLYWFVDFNKTKQKECKYELKKLGVYEKGMIKELKQLIKYAKELELLPIELIEDDPIEDMLNY